MKTEKEIREKIDTIKKEEKIYGNKYIQGLISTMEFRSNVVSSVAKISALNWVLEERENEMLDEQAKQITKAITPKYPLGYSDVYPIVFNYLQECYLANTKCDNDEIDKRLRNYVVRGY